MRTIIEKFDRVFLFGSGVLVSATVSAILGDRISLSVSVLVFSVIVLAVFGVYYFKHSNDRIHELADGMEVTARFVYELNRENEDIVFSAVTYTEIIRLIRGAQRQILVLASMHREGANHNTDEHNKRLEYFREIEDKLVRGFNS